MKFKAYFAFLILAAFVMASEISPFESGGKFGYADKNGFEIISPRYDLAYEFSDEVAVVVVGCDKICKHGLIDKNGEFIIPAIYEHVFLHKSGLVLIALDGLNWGVADRNGKVLVPVKFTKISFLSSGEIEAQKGKATAFFSQNGEFLSGDIDDSDDSDYSIASIISRYATYPNEALELGISGKVVVQFTLTPHGQIKDIKIKNSSGHKILDDAAIKTIKEISAKFPKPSRDTQIIAPISYKVSG